MSELRGKEATKVNPDPFLGGSGGGGCTKSITKGFVMIVDKCPDQELWFYVDSLGKIEMIAEKEAEYISATKVYIAAPAIEAIASLTALIKADKQVDIEAGEAASIKAGQKLTVVSPNTEIQGDVHITQSLTVDGELIYQGRPLSHWFAQS